MNNVLLELVSRACACSYSQPSPREGLQHDGHCFTSVLVHVTHC